MEKIKDLVKRVGIEITILSILVLVVISGLHMFLPNSIQSIMSKIIYISAGLLHAHFAGKLIFNTKINWNEKIENQKGAFYARIGLYVSFPIGYALGV